jgi:hypothetical protein
MTFLTVGRKMCLFMCRMDLFFCDLKRIAPSGFCHRCGG